MINLRANADVSAYQLFSQNLLALCNANGSIADVCRATGINRQQFNKYLSGQVLPSRANLDKICRHFKVSSQHLFISADLQTNSVEPNSSFGRLCASLAEDSAAATLSPGLYWLYAKRPTPESPLQRMLFRIVADQNMSIVHGIRRLGPAGKPAVGMRPVLTQGIALQIGSRLSLLFREIGSLARWGMVNIAQNEIENRSTLASVALGFLPGNEPMATLGIIQLIDTDGANWLKHYRQAGYIDVEFAKTDAFASTVYEIFQSQSGTSLVAPELNERLLRSQLQPKR